MESKLDKESDIADEIQKTLLSMNQLMTKIKNELCEVNHMVKEKGLLYTAVLDTNKRFTAVANDMGLDIEDILSTDEEEQEVLLVEALKQKIMQYLRTP